MTRPTRGRVGGACGSPSVKAWIVPSPGVEICGVHVTNVSAPDDHFFAGPNRGRIPSASGCVVSIRRCPTIHVGIVSAASVKPKARVVASTPDDHSAAAPDCPVTGSGSGRVGDACGCPSVSAWIVPSPGVEKTTAVVISAPDDHFSARPDRRVKPSCRGRVGGAGGCPAVSAGIISSAGVEKGARASLSAPDDHLTAGPDASDQISAKGGVGECRCGPRVIDAAARRTSYRRKRVSRIRWIGRSADDGGKSRRPGILDRFAIRLVIERRSARSTYVFR
jgi:hypothetical protein